MVKLAIDIMGGDHAPLEIIKGVKIALERFPDIELVLFGDEKVIKEHLRNMSVSKLFMLLIKLIWVKQTRLGRLEEIVKLL